MSISSQDKSILKNLIAATGISEEIISSEIQTLASRVGLDPEELTIEDLRQILADYVQEVLLSAKEEFSSREPNHSADSKAESKPNPIPLFPSDI